MDRNIFLDNMPLEEATTRWFSMCRQDGVRFPLEAEIVETGEVAGRVTAEPLFARVSSPPFHSSAMDGVAVVASSTYGASEVSPLRLKLGENAAFIDTGEPVPAGYDAVIMVEDLNRVEEGVFEIIKPAAPWQNVRPLGEDIVETELILPRGHRVRPVDIGALLNAGYTGIPVRKKPLIAIIPTGTELVEDPDDVEHGKVMESNSWTLAAFSEVLGARALRTAVIPDERDKIVSAVEEALERCDAVVINAGTSAGREDYTRSIIEELGRLAVHGVAMRPGKPVVLGVAGGKPVVGLPGFPVANYRGAQEFLEPLIMAFLGLAQRETSTIEARLARKIFSTPGFDEFIQVKVGMVNDEMVAVPLPRGSGVSMSLVRSDGVIRVPAESEGVSRWDRVEVMLHDRDVNPEGTILAIGSHDVSLDILANRVREKDPRISFASANVGSMGGILAVKQGQAHIAGIHLLDPETGEFNIPYILRQLSVDDVILIHLAWRTQGLMVLPGNPKGVEEIADLARGDIIFVNRQKGSGTRLLLDYQMKKAGIEPESVYGYGREMFTHTSVAAAVAGRTADVGLGVLAAAKALRLEFIPVARERYDLLVLRSFQGSRGYRALTGALSDPDYRREVEALGGYDMADSGDIIPLGGK